MPNPTTMGVRSDVLCLRADLREYGSDAELLRTSVSKPLFDIAFDYAVVAAATLSCAWISLWLCPLAVLLIGNRQRSLGNILHDGSHGNLHRWRELNDVIVRVLLAPLLFVSLTKYRSDHARHHARLGEPGGDPDLLQPPERAPHGWLGHYGSNVFKLSSWWGSTAGHLGQRGASSGSRLTILAWWVAMASIVGVMGGLAVLVAFLVLWLLARATTFHLITTFREMCDHFGLQPGGVCSFTRDVVVTSHAWSWFLHPRNNGLHLTHHLLPSVPYYRLPAAQRVLRSLPTYQMHATIRSSYFFGNASVVACWRRARLS